MANDACNFAGRGTRAGEEIAARRTRDGRAGILGDHQPAPWGAIGEGCFDEDRRTEAVDEPVHREAPALRKRHLGRGDRAEGGIRDRRFAEEDEGVVPGHQGRRLVRVVGQPRADGAHRRAALRQRPHRDQLAADAGLPDQPRPQAFRGMTIAWNCRTREEVDAVMAFALGKGAKLVKTAHETHYGGYSGYFADPDGHPWEVVVAPGIEVGEDRRIHLPE